MNKPREEKMKETTRELEEVYFGYLLDLIRQSKTIDEAEKLAIEWWAGSGSVPKNKASRVSDNPAFETPVTIDQSYSQGRLDREREIDKKYNELIMAVESKHKGETRHETALRYIKNAEKGSDRVCASLDKTDKEEKLTKED